MAYGKDDRDVLVGLLNEEDTNKTDKKLTPIGKEPETNITTAIASTLRKFSQIADRPPIIETPAGQNDSDEYSYEKTVLFGRFRNEDMGLLRKAGLSIKNTTGTRQKSNSDKNVNSKISVDPLDNINFELPTRESKLYRNFERWHKVVLFVVEDWIFLGLLGIIMAICSLAMDQAIDHLQKFHLSILDFTTTSTEGNMNIALTYLVWISYAMVLVTGSALFVHYLAPQAIGSGIPEMKTILRGVILKEYLTFKTLVSKMIGLTLSLGSGIPIGKEGPFVHVASVVANLLSHLVHSFHGVYANESRSSEMLAAGCAVGVACTFSAPVGGVLFSIEVTSVYFAVRNYWRGFFAAACSATLFRLLRVLIDTEVTVVAFHQTEFPHDAFLPEELPIFAFIGLICGILSAFFIFLQRCMVLFLRHNKYIKAIFQRFWVIYPVLISFIIASITYPNGVGMFLGGDIRFSQTPRDLFKNCTWTALNSSALYCKDMENWKGPGGEYSIFICLTCFVFFLTALASTLPIPAGIFGPSFVLGAAMGRIIGEFVAVLYPDGLRGSDDLQVYPGVYAVVGAAAFCGGVTHTVSVAVIVFEMTGQLLYILPVMIAVLVANAICSYLQPSIYDSIIKIKHLPYLPDIPPTSSSFHGIRAEQIMTRNVKYLSKDSTYAEVQDLMLEMPRLKAFPVVEDKISLILIGSCSRHKLLRALENVVGHEARQAEAHRRIKQAIENIDRRFKLIDQERANLSGPKTKVLKNEIMQMMNSSEIRDNASTVPAIRYNEVDKQRTSDTEVQKPAPKILLNELSMDEYYEDGPPPNLSDNNRKTSRFTIVPVNGKDSLNTLTERRGGLSVDQPDRPDISNSDDEEITVQRNPSSYSFRSYRSSQSHKINRRNSLHQSAHDVYNTIGGIVRTLTRMSMGRRFKRPLGEEDYDLSGEERKAWEREQLDKFIDLDEVGVDPAPFQLVEHSSLFKVHSLFSLLGLNRAYVTDCGKLVGVVALRDLRLAIERAQNGLLFSDSMPIHEEMDMDITGKTISENLDSKEGSDDDTENILHPRLEIISRSNSEQSLVLEEALLERAEMGLSRPKTKSFLHQHGMHVAIVRTSSDTIIRKEKALPGPTLKKSQSLMILNPSVQNSTNVKKLSANAVLQAKFDSGRLSPSISSSGRLSPAISISGDSDTSVGRRKKSHRVKICAPPTMADDSNEHEDF